MADSGDLFFRVEPELEIAAGEHILVNSEDIFFQPSFNYIIDETNIYIYKNISEVLLFEPFISLHVASVVECFDINENMIINDINPGTCSQEDVSQLVGLARFRSQRKVKNMEYKRYRGDTYPVKTVLSINGNYDVTDMTFIMSTKIGEEQIYQSVGSILIPESGIVTFDLDPTAVAIAGEGSYDIQGTTNSGAIHTYVKDKFTLLDDLTV